MGTILAYYLARIRLWRVQMKIRLALWLCHRVEVHLDKVLNDNGYQSVGAGFLGLFLLEAAIIFFR